MPAMTSYREILRTTDTIALATSVDNRPNVRMVNICYEVDKPGVLYFATDEKNSKVAEFKANNRVAISSIPQIGQPHFRSQKAVVRKSEKTVAEMKDLFIAQIPAYEEILAILGDKLDIYEIHLEEVKVVLGLDAIGTLVPASYAKG